MVCMRRDDVELLRDVQRSTWEAMTAIDTLLDKEMEAPFSMELSREALRYADIHNRAVAKLLEQQGRVYRGNYMEELLLKGSIHADTLMDISTRHLADMMIQRSHKGLTAMWSSMKHHDKAGEACMELAEELAALEEDAVKKFRDFL